MEAVDAVEQHATSVGHEDVRDKQTESQTHLRTRLCYHRNERFQLLLTHHREDERVGEVLIQGELDYVPA